jgi:hypothetical protein
MGGQSATVASAYTRDPAIADKVIVFYVSANAYNGHLCGPASWSAKTCGSYTPTIDGGSRWAFRTSSKRCLATTLPTGMTSAES